MVVLLFCFFCRGDYVMVFLSLRYCGDGGGVQLISQQPPDVGFQSLFQGHCAANVATLGGRSTPERLCAFCACAFCIGGLATCDHCAANVATLGGRSKPERLCAFCACAFCVVWAWLLATTALLMLPRWGAGVNLSACMHFAHVRFALVDWLLCDHRAANVATLGGRSEPERLYAFCACAFCIACCCIGGPE